jgi:hypothetical protein
MNKKEIRKIFNFNSIILKDKTIEYYGYDPDSLGKSSAKFIIATCRFCGKEHHIRKGFFNKAGSACHKACKLIEQGSFSPMLDHDRREKAMKKIEEKYGTRYASQNTKIAAKISKSKRNLDAIERVKQTVLDKYGVDNVSKDESIKKKIKNTFKSKYNKDHPMQVKSIKDQVKKTCINKYGVDNPLKDKDILQRSVESFRKHVFNNPDKYPYVTVLRKKEFWDDLESSSLKKVCEKFGLSYQTVASFMSRDEFKDKFQDTYSFPKCQAQNLIQSTLENLGLKCDRNRRDVISPKELDIYIQDQNFAIEYNGSIWHSEKMNSSIEARKKHIYKTQLCHQKGIRLFHIFEHQWIERESQIMNFIKSALNINKRRIFARSCQLTNTNEKQFINDNHIQGYGFRTIKWFNLVYKGEVVASMTASKHHRQGNSEKDVILNRLCFADGISAVGGSSKLFKYFAIWAKNEGYQRILSWSDNCWTEGNIYNVLGFNLEKEYGPDYFYYDTQQKRYRSKQSQRKSATKCPEGMTEREWCIQRGLYRIWDCGKKKWTYDLISEI